MKHQWKLIVALILGVVGAILDFALHMPHLTAIIIDIAALLMALSMLREMVMDLKVGNLVNIQKSRFSQWFTLQSAVILL